MPAEDQSVVATLPQSADDPNIIILTDDKGVLKHVLQEGTDDDAARPFDGYKILCHYTGRNADGSQFDSSVGREPFEFELGAGTVIKGFDLGVASMRKGEKALFTFEPSYAYGATVTFEIELLGWRAQDLSPKKDGGIEKHNTSGVATVTKKNGSRKTPVDGVAVQVHITGRYDGRIFDDRDVEFNVGEVPESEVCAGIQFGLLHFVKDETARLVIAPQYAFGAKGHAAFGIPPNVSVEYTVTLHSFEKETKSWKFDEAENVEQAKVYKEKGIGFYRQELYELAIKMYNKSNSFLSSCTNEESQQIKVAVFLNIALCYQKLNDHTNVKSACNTSLEIEPDNIKALYRRGTACLKSGETDTALADFMRVKQLDPSNVAVVSQIAACRKINRDAHEKDKKLYANMFSKFASVDNEKEEIVRNEGSDVLAACGEWNMDEEARKEADRAFKEVEENVVMI